MPKCALACAVHQSARAVLARPQCAFTHYRACGFNLPLLATYDSAFDSWRRQHDISTSWRRSMSILEQEIGSRSLSHRLASCRNRKISFIRPQPRAGSWAFLRTPGGRCTVNAFDALAIATSTLLRSVVEFVDMLSVGSNSEHRGIRQAMHSAAEAARAVAALIATRDEDILNLESEELQKHVRGDEEPRVSELEQKNYGPLCRFISGHESSRHCYSLHLTLGTRLGNRLHKRIKQTVSISAT